MNARWIIQSKFSWHFPFILHKYFSTLKHPLLAGIHNYYERVGVSRSYICLQETWEYREIIGGHQGLGRHQKLIGNSEWAVQIQTTEAEGRRELTQHGVLPCLAGGEGGGAMICTVMGGPYRLPWRTLLPTLMRSCSAVSFWKSKLLLLLYLNVHKTPTWSKSRKKGRPGAPCTQFDSSQDSTPPPSPQHCSSTISNENIRTYRLKTRFAI